MEFQWQSYFLENVIMFEFWEVGIVFYLKGFNFVYEGYVIYNGYGFKFVVGMLQEQFSFGVNVVVIVFYLYMCFFNVFQFLFIMN